MRATRSRRSWGRGAETAAGRAAGPVLVAVSELPGLLIYITAGGSSSCRCRGLEQRCRVSPDDNTQARRSQYPDRPGFLGGCDLWEGRVHGRTPVRPGRCLHGDGRILMLRRAPGATYAAGSCALRRGTSRLDADRSQLQPTAAICRRSRDIRGMDLEVFPQVNSRKWEGPAENETHACACHPPPGASGPGHRTLPAIGPAPVRLRARAGQREPAQPDAGRSQPSRRSALTSPRPRTSQNRTSVVSFTPRPPAVIRARPGTRSATPAAPG